MIEETKKTARGRLNPAKTTKPPTNPKNPWQRGASINLNQSVRDGLYSVYYHLDKATRQDLGLMMKVPVFIKDPLVAMENPTLGVQEISVRLEKNMGSGPTSSRVAVVDYNANNQELTTPVIWDDAVGWFQTPLPQSEWLPGVPDVPEDMSKVEDPDKYSEQYRQFIEKTVKNPYFHQVNVWAVVQRVLEFCEESSALGRPVPWGFDGNRLIVVPHAGYGENAFYDQHSKSLQFYYFGDQSSPGYTCLSHDIIAHETGHAILDGIRPLYSQVSSSVQTGAFHEFFGDLMAILLALFNQDIRHFVAQTTAGQLNEANVLADLAPQFGEETADRPYLRTAFNKLTMQDKAIRDSLSPHNISQVMTWAMWDILASIADKHLEKNLPTVSTKIDGLAEGEASSPEAASEKPRVFKKSHRLRRCGGQPIVSAG